MPGNKDLRSARKRDAPVRSEEKRFYSERTEATVYPARGHGPRWSAGQLGQPGKLEADGHLDVLSIGAVEVGGLAVVVVVGEAVLQAVDGDRVPERGVVV